VTHAEKLAAAERAVVDAAVAWLEPINSTASDHLETAVKSLIALRAQTCPTCKGTTEKDYPYFDHAKGKYVIGCMACHGTGRSPEVKS
jgi:hypothetical protein